MAQFQLRAYAGKECGLMVIGTAAEFSELAAQLNDTENKLPNSSVGFPQLILTLPATGPYSDREDFSLSFHLATPGTSLHLLPIKRVGLPTWLFISTASLSVVGAFTVVRWLLGFAA